MARLKELYSRYHAVVHVPRSYWGARYGPVRLQARMSSLRIAQVFITFCALTFGVGAAFTFLDGTRELGIAMVVGAMFTAGSVIVQYWALRTAVEISADERLEDHFIHEDVDDVVRRLKDVRSAIRGIDPHLFGSPD